MQFGIMRHFRSCVFFYVAFLTDLSFATKAMADTLISDFTVSGFNELNSGTTQVLGPTFASYSNPVAQQGAGGAFTYTDLNLTGLTGFNITYNLILGTGVPGALLTLQTNDNDGTFGLTSSFNVPSTNGFVTEFFSAPIPFGPGTIDPAHLVRIGFSASDTRFNAGQITLQIDKIEAVVPEPQTVGLLVAAGAMTGLLAFREGRIFRGKIPFSSRFGH